MFVFSAKVFSEGVPLHVIKFFNILLRWSAPVLQGLRATVRIRI